MKYILCVLAMLSILSACKVDGQAKSYPLPKEFLGEWEIYSDDFPHGYRFNENGTIDLIIDDPKQARDYTNEYKFIFQDKDGIAYYLEREYDPQSFSDVYINGLLLKTNSSGRLLLQMHDINCSLSLEDWNDFRPKEIKKYILSMTADPYDQDCMNTASIRAYHRP